MYLLFSGHHFFMFDTGNDHSPGGLTDLRMVTSDLSKIVDDLVEDRPDWWQVLDYDTMSAAYHIDFPQNDPSHELLSAMKFEALDL